MKKHGSPSLRVVITEDQRQRAIRSSSGGCLIADAIKAQYPQFTKVTVDTATIRLSDRKVGVRYTYLTPPDAQHLLLAFDQGWDTPVAPRELRIARAVHVAPIRAQKRGAPTSVRLAAERVARLAELEDKERAGTLTRHERGALTRMRNAKPTVERPTADGPVEVVVRSNGETTVYGGRRPPQGPAHPNLLRGSNRHFGARLADPGLAFREALDAELTRRLDELTRPDDGSPT